MLEWIIYAVFGLGLGLGLLIGWALWRRPKLNYGGEHG